MTLGANQIGAYAADLLDLEDQITALQDSKRDLYASIRDEHGKAEANALKQAVKLSRMDSEKRTERDEIDTEAQRMLAIIEKSRAPRATHAIAKDVPVSTPVTPAAGQGEGTVAPGSLANQSSEADAASAPVEPSSTELGDGNGLRLKGNATAKVNSAAAIRDVGSRESGSLVAGGITQCGDDAPPSLHPTPTAADQARKLRPYCQHADDLTKCAGQGRKHCFACQKAHADEVGEAA